MIGKLLSISIVVVRALYHATVYCLHLQELAHCGGFASFLRSMENNPLNE